MALAFGAAQARAAGLRVRREGDCASAAGHTRRPLGLGTAAPQSGCPHPSRAQGPLGSQPPPYCGRGVIFHTAVPREACTPLRSSYGDFQVKNLTRVLGGRPRSWLDRPARPDPNVYHSFERDPQKYCFSAKITRVALWSCGSTHMGQFLASDSDRSSCHLYHVSISAESIVDVRFIGCIAEYDWVAQ